jgi:hypothetical protein
MPRLRYSGEKYERSVFGVLDLTLGPTTESEHTLDQLRVMWEIERDRLMAGTCNGVGQRPWAFWVFDVGEDPPREAGCREPDPEPIRLAELGLLTPEELAAIREDANVARTRIGTDAELIAGGGRIGLERPVSPMLCIESFDRKAVLLEERVTAALKERQA